MDTGSETFDGIGLGRININLHVKSFTESSWQNLDVVFVACTGCAVERGLMKVFGGGFGLLGWLR